MVGGVIAFGQFLGSVSQSRALLEQGKYAETVGMINARFSEMQARDSIKRGENEALQHGKRIQQTVGAQRAALAAQGIVVSEGSAAEIQESTLEIGAQEVENIRSNAWREAFGLRTQAVAQRMGGAMARQEASFAAESTLVTGALGALNWGVQFQDRFGDAFSGKNQKIPFQSGKARETSAFFDPRAIGKEIS